MLELFPRLWKYENVNTSDAVLALAALAQASRLEIFRLLVQAGPAGMAAGGIAQSLDVPPATLSFHLKALAHAGLVESHQEGRHVFYRARFEAMNALLAYLTENCCGGAVCETSTPSCRPKGNPHETTARAPRRNRS